MKTVATAVAAAMVMGWVGVACAAGPALQTEQQRLGYTVGFQIGHNLKSEGLDIDVDALSQAIGDVFKGTPPRLSEDEMRAAVETLQAKLMAERERMAEENLQAGRAFLAKNGERAGVVQTASGLQYEVKKTGSGAQPKSTDTVSVHYRGTLIDGSEFDSSYSRGEPAVFPVDGVIDGWREALPLMKVGDQWRVFIPAELAYGDHGAGDDIPPNSALIFDVELLSIE